MSEYPTLSIETEIDLDEMDAVGKTYFDESPIDAEDLAEAIEATVNAETARQLLQNTYEANRNMQG